MTEAAGLGPCGHPSIWRPRSLVFFFSLFPVGEGLRWPLPFLFSLAPWTGETGARPHLSDAWGVRGEESWHCSHKTNVM